MTGTEQITTADAQGRRLWVYTADVKGRFRTLRTRVSAVLLVIFLALPWLKWRGHHALLLDVIERRFTLFGMTFWSHDTPLIFFGVATVVILIAWATAVFGRVWCGWACPQTIFTEMVFRKVERWVEGDALTRKRRDQGPWTLDKGIKKAIKAILFTLMALILSHSLLAYFVGTHKLGQMMRSSPGAHPGTFSLMFVIFSGVLFNFGWFREQFCTLVCPYGRFQSVLLDDQSSVVQYDLKRGDAGGDCIQCGRCVQVCPTGIDIRRGLQMECIACSSCLDACNEVMRRVGKPPGLIHYVKPKGLRPRPLILAAIAFCLVASLSWVLLNRHDFEVTVRRSLGMPFEVVTTESGTSLVNRFLLEVQNQSLEDHQIQLQAIDSDPALQIRIVSAELPSQVISGSRRQMGFFIQFNPQGLKRGRAKISLKISSERGEVQFEEVSLVGPV